MGEKSRLQPADLVGCSDDDPKIPHFLLNLQGSALLPKPVKESFSALKSRPPCVYHNFKDLGVSLCYEGSVLQAAHLYNGTHGYSTYQGELGHGIRLQMCGAEIVKLLGEPDGKMGGGKGGPISLVYKDKGLQFNFIGNNWADKENILDSVTVHEPI